MPANVKAYLCALGSLDKLAKSAQPTTIKTLLLMVLLVIIRLSKRRAQ